MAKAKTPKKAGPAKATKTKKPKAKAKRAAKAEGPKARAKKGATGKMATRRADYGAPIDGFFAKQPPHLREILEALRKLVEEAAPDATSSIKWGMPFYSIDGAMMCALGAHKSHVNLILAGPPGTFADPGGLLEGEGKTGKHLKLTKVGELPRDRVRGWLRTAAKLAREKS